MFNMYRYLVFNSLKIPIFEKFYLIIYAWLININVGTFLFPDLHEGTEDIQSITMRGNSILYNLIIKSRNHFPLYFLMIRQVRSKK